MSADDTSAGPPRTRLDSGRVPPIGAWPGGSFGDAYEVLGILETNPYADRLVLFSRSMHAVVAMRTIRPEHASHPNVVLRFHEVMAPWVTMQPHPNIVRAFYDEEIGGHPFIATDWIGSDERGLWNLQRAIERRQTVLPTILEWAADLCDGLEEAAVCGLEPHLSLHPTNIFVTYDGRLQIDGFGLVQALAESPHLPASHVHVDNGLVGMCSNVSQAGVGLGFPTHMPPEQFVDARQCGHKASLYSIGVILYQLCSGGQLPFVAQASDDPRQYLSHQYQAHVTLIPQPLDTPLWPIISRLLEKNPSERYPSYADLRDDVEALAHRSGVQLRSLMGEDDLSGSTWINRGMGLHAFGFVDSALFAYNRGEEKTPDDPRLWRERAACHNELEQYDEALGAVTRALDINPGEIFAWHDRGMVHRFRGDLEASLADFEQAILLDEFEPLFWCSKGLTLHALERLEEASPAYQRALELGLNDPVVQQMVGNAYGVLGYYREALQCFDQAAILHPRRPTVWLDRGRLLSALDRHGEAVDSLIRGLDLDPSMPLLWFELGASREGAGELEGAAEAYKEYLRLASSGEIRRTREAKIRLKSLRDSGVSGAHRSNVGMVSRHGTLTGDPHAALRYHQEGLDHHEGGRFHEAVDAFGRALGFDPLNVAIWMDAAETLLVTGQSDEALRCVNSAIEMNPTEAMQWSRLARMLDHLERSHQAMRCHDRALQLNPGLAAAWNNKGLSLIVDGLPGYMLPDTVVSEAIACFDAALKIDVNSALAWLGKGLSLRASSRERDATRCLQRAVSLDAGFQDAWRALAETYQSLGQHSEAYEAAGRALQLNGEDPGAWTVRAAAERVMGRPQEALHAADQALLLQPNHVRAVGERARSLLALHQVQEALGAFETAVQLAPHDPLLLFEKGQAEITHGVWRAAERSLRQFLQAAPEDLQTERDNAERYLVRLKRMMGGG